MATVTEILAASQGSFVVNDTDEETRSFDGILVLEDTVFASIKQGGVDIKANLISTPASAVKTGAFIRPASGSFSGVQLTSGSVALVL